MCVQDNQQKIISPLEVAELCSKCTFFTIGFASKKVMGLIPSLGSFCVERITILDNLTSSPLGCELSLLWLNVIGIMLNYHGCHQVILSSIFVYLNWRPT